MKFSLLNKLLWSIFVFALISWFSLIYLHHYLLTADTDIDTNTDTDRHYRHHHHQYHHHQYQQQQQYQYHKKKKKERKEEKQKQKKKNYDETAAICAVVKDEDRYLEEWLLYHLGIGFDHIYMYDDSPNTTTVRWVQNYGAADDDDYDDNDDDD